MVKGNDIQERLVNFAAKIIKITAELPKTIAGNHIGKQLLRSGTSPAPNYAEARSAERYLEIYRENDELCRIISASAKTALKRIVKN